MLPRVASRLPMEWQSACHTRQHHVLAQRITLWCPPLSANFLKRELPQPSSLRRVTLRSIGCLHKTSLLWDSGSCRPQTQVYKPHFPVFFSQFLDFSPYEQYIFVHNERSLCFLGLVDLIIHKQHKTQAFWVSATDSYGEKNTSCPPGAFRTSLESRDCKHKPKFRSIVLLSYRSCSPEKLSPLK